MTCSYDPPAGFQEGLAFRGGRTLGRPEVADLVDEIGAYSPRQGGFQIEVKRLSLVYADPAPDQPPRAGATGREDPEAHDAAFNVTLGRCCH